MRWLLLGCLALTACGPHPVEKRLAVASPPVPGGAAVAKDAADAPDADVIAAAAKEKNRGVRIEGMERFDRVSLLEANVLCGTRAGHRPVCATDPQWEAYARPYEELSDVVSLETLDFCHCVLFGNGTLRCLQGVPVGAPAIERPMEWPVVAEDVAAFEIGPTGKQAQPLVFVLDRRGGVRAQRPPRASTESGAREAAEPMQVVLPSGARRIASAGQSAVCAALVGGGVVCGEASSPGHFTLRRFDGARDVFSGGIIVLADGHWTFMNKEVAPLYSPLPEMLDGYASQGMCVLQRGAVTCAGLGRGWIDVTLPGTARRLTPEGAALCAELTDGSTACWGPFLKDIARLGARARRTPEKPAWP